MPHTIHLFLSQISEGYWSRGTPAIVINAGHVLQACPHPCLEYLSSSSTTDGGESSPSIDDPYIDMKHAGLDSVSFQEYSPLYPHEKYTIGFAGRPHSGPEFYINLLNNTLDHGPVEAGYAKLVLEEEGGVVVDERVLEPDPCFGKVVEGFDVVDLVARRVTRSTLPASAKEGSSNANDGGEVDEAFDNTLLVRPVKIVSVTILENYKKEDTEGATTESDDRDEL